MPAWIRMPEERDLPRGAMRDFVEVVHYHYRAAHRPPLRKISNRVVELVEHSKRSDGRLDGTASKETIRRMLLGKVLPQWSTVEVVYLALCDLAGEDPNASHHDGGYGYTYRDEISRAWNDAIDEPPNRQIPAVPEDDPWATGSQRSGWGGGYPDEPPF